MKTIKLSLNKIAVVTLLVSMVLVSCKREPIQPPKRTCEHKATFEKMEGFEGYYGDYIIRLEDKSILFPCIVEDKTFTRDNIFEGMPITVSYKVVNSEETSCKIPYSPYILPAHRYYKAKITCIADDRVVEECKQGWCGTEW